MPNSPVLPALAQVIADHFQADAASVTAETTAWDVNGWDSLTHTLLLIKIEQAFQVRLDEGAAFRAANVGELAAAVEQAVRKAS